MKKLFISQPMKEKTNEEIRKEREDAVFCAKELMGDEIEVIDSFFENVPAEARPLWYLGESLKLLSTADVAYFSGWKNARGCKIEHICAEQYGINIVEA